MSEDSPAPWVSVRAVAWVLDEAPDVPANLLPTLVSLARHADADGRGCWLSKHRLAWHTRKGEEQVKRDLRQLRDRGLIRLGDQGLVAQLPADKRPTVYDLAVERRREAYVPPTGGLVGSPDGERGNSQVPSRGASEVPPEQERGNPQVRAGEPGGVSGGTHRFPKEDPEEDLKKRSLRASAEQTILARTDATEDETKEVLRRIIAKHDPASPEAYVRRMAKEGDLAQWLAEVRAERAQQPAVARAGVECPHGELGGATLHPHTQLPVCPLCRAHVRMCELDPLYCPECQAIRRAAGLPPDPRLSYGEAG